MVLAQYNPSTGKASYNAVTEKQQASLFLDCPDVVNCNQCSVTPKGLIVTFTDVITITDGVCYSNWYGGYFEGADLSVTINTRHAICQDPSDPCIWTGYITSESPFAAELYSDSNCDNMTDDTSTNPLKIIVERPFGGITPEYESSIILIAENYAGPTLPPPLDAYFFSQIYNSPSGCVGATSLPNGLVAGPGETEYPSLAVPGYSGTVTIEEIF